MRLRNRRRHLRSHGTKAFLHLLGVAPVLYFRDHDQPLGASILDGNRRDTAAADLLSGRLDVIGVMVTPVDDQQVFDAADDEQLAVVDGAQVAGAQPWAQRGAARGVDELTSEGLLRLLRLSAGAGGDGFA